MEDNKGFGEELIENKATQVGGATLAAAGMSQIGIATGGLGALATGKAGIIIATVGGPIGIAIGGALIAGGLIATLYNRRKK